MATDFGDSLDTNEFACSKHVEADDSWKTAINEQSSRLQQARADVDAALRSSKDERDEANLDNPAMTPEQLQLSERDHKHARSELIDTDHLDKAYFLRYDDGNVGIYKPVDGEYSTSWPALEPGSNARGEVAAYRVDKVLGLDLVPPTVMIDEPYGPGSLQEYVPLPGLDPSLYSTVEQQKMGTLDYIIGNTDRHARNYLTQADGRPAAIDNGRSFPTDPSGELMSDFFPAVMNQPLDPSIIGSVSTISNEELTDVLKQAHLSQRSIDGVLARIDEVRSGQITGRAWGGRISLGR